MCHNSGEFMHASYNGTQLKCCICIFINKIKCIDCRKLQIIKKNEDKENGPRWIWIILKINMRSNSILSSNYILESYSFYHRLFEFETDQESKSISKIKDR